MIAEDEVENYETFRDCLSTVVIEKLAPTNHQKKRRVKGRKNEIKPVQVDRDDEADVADLSEFVEYLTEEMFPSLPPDLRTLSYAAIQDDTSLAVRYSVPLDSDLLENLISPLPLTITDSLTSYKLLSSPSDLLHFLTPVITTYVTATTSPPPSHTPSVTASRPSGCEICDREHLPLTYHHLIPRQMHAKAVKRGWHAEWELNKVAWLCRACHSFVHKVATNEELAREWFAVEFLLEREDVRRWAGWVGRVRWKAR